MAKILVADDDASIEKLIAHSFRALPWEISSASDGEAAIKLLAGSAHDLVITDLDMPRVDGHALTKHVVEKYPQVPVVVLTGKGNEETAISCFREGAADYIRKENLKTELIASVAKLLKEEEEVERLLAEAKEAAKEAEAEGTSEGDSFNSAASARIESLEKDYVVRRWGNAVQSLGADRGEEREFSEQKLRVLRRQVERLEKWSELEQAQTFQRKHERHVFGDVVFLIPYSEPGKLDIGRRFATFCRNVSPGGCSVIRNRLLRDMEWGVFFPHLMPASPQPVCFAAKIVRDRPITLGMYEIGMSFKGIHKIPSEDIAIMLARGAK